MLTKIQHRLLPKLLRVRAKGPSLLVVLFMMAGTFVSAQGQGFSLQDPSFTGAAGAPSPASVQGGLFVFTAGSFSGPVTFSLQYSGPSLPLDAIVGIPSCIAGPGFCWNATPPYESAATVTIPNGGLYINDVFVLVSPSGDLPSGNYSITITAVSSGQTTQQTTFTFSL